MKAEKFLSDEGNYICTYKYLLEFFHLYCVCICFLFLSELEKWKQTVLVIQERDNVKQFSEDSYKYFGPYLTHDVDEFDAENKNEERIEKWVKEGRAAFFKKVEQHLIRGNFQPFLDSLKDDPRGAKFIKYCMEIPPILKVGSKLAHRAKGSALPISISKFLNKSKYSHLTTNYLLEIDDYFANFILPKSPV